MGSISTIDLQEGGTLAEDASDAVGHALRHRGYLKAQVTPQLRPLKPSAGSKDAEVALELAIKAGKQYRVKDLNFAGHSTQVAERDLKQACNIPSGEIADGEQVGTCISSLPALFKKHGQDVYVVPSMGFDDASSITQVPTEMDLFEQHCLIAFDVLGKTERS